MSMHPVVTRIEPAITEVGKISWSIDGLGVYPNSTGIIQVEKPAGATVRCTYMAAATTGVSGYQLQAGDIKIDGADVVWTKEIPTSISSYNYWADVTSLIKAKIDAAPAGRIDFNITESPAYQTDGELLVVIFDDPAQTTDNTIILNFGAQNTTGDYFNISLAKPIDLNDPNLALDFSLASSYSYQEGGMQQFSIVDVNGQRMTSWAGGDDDGTGPSSNGELFTVGGLDDSTDNPADPNGQGDKRYDDELYTLLPFVSNGDTNIIVQTLNPSNDDNLLFAGLFLRSVLVASIQDFGDAPDSYLTVLASDGAGHRLVDGVYLGQLIDGEPDGIPTAGADGDDADNLSDEDGVVFATPVTQGSSAAVQVTASVAGMLNAWIDFNGNGNWADADEQIFTDEILVAGVNNLNFDVPSGAAEGDTYARFRFNTQGGLPFNGSAADGEVEDYVIEIEASTPPEPEPEPEPIESQPDRNFDSLEVGSDSAIAMNSFMGPRLKTLATNNLEIKKNQDSGACPDDCCDPWIKSVGPDGTVESHDCKDCCTKYNRDTIKVGSRDAIAFGMASATNNVKVVAEQK
ncbi:MAG: hypothetical protein HGA93_01515 [Methanothrix sp.]|nr:hypothetical protein [Methanothrix sp.]